MNNDNNDEEIVLEKIIEVKKRFPYHSVQSYLIIELEELEEELAEIRKRYRENNFHIDEM